jgi:hypothetical protein
MNESENRFERGEWIGGEWIPSDDDADELPAPPRKDIAPADRELLELAARALGAVRTEEVDGEGYLNLHFDDTPTMFGWNPLLFGDDTFVLAARLDLLRNNVRVEHYLSLEEKSGTPPLIASKRAVVLAAAEIGEQHS